MGLIPPPAQALPVAFIIVVLIPPPPQVPLMPVRASILREDYC
jgi:hypothetical protein